MQRQRKPFNLFFILLVVILVVYIIQMANRPPNPTQITFTRFSEEIGRTIDASGDTIFDPGANRIYAIVQQGNTFFIMTRVDANGAIISIDEERLNNFLSNPGQHAQLQLFYQNTFEITAIIDAQILAMSNSGHANAHAVHFRPIPVGTSFWEILYPILMIGAILLVAFILIRGLSSRGGVMNMGKNRATKVMNSPVRFQDVAGIDEEKLEVSEIVEFLREPRKFLDLGARIPKRFLLVGAPGTGKTLLAKAIAGEAQVPFFSISGSDFSEMLVGVGPSRMRDLFEEAKMNAPCIVFIDEIDSIARMRGVGISGASEENEQTLNQLLVQMDGFTKSEGVIVMAATNRPDVLDPALLRPGRFDRQIIVQMPDIKGREKILEVHTKNKPISSDVDINRVAKITSGFTGADIENLMNESAIIAARKNKHKISMQDITEGINKVLLGPQKLSRIITEPDKKITAFHEAGHAIVARILNPEHTVQEVSIIPRGMAAGYTLTSDNDDVTAHRSRTYLQNQIALLLAGRAAEQMFLGDFCTGCSEDLKRATNIADKMVTHFGMSDKLGPLYYGRHDEAIMRAYSDRNVSDNMQSVIDSEIRTIITDAEKKAIKILEENKKKIEVMVDLLIERETIYSEDIDLILEGKTKKVILEKMDEREENRKKREAEEKLEAKVDAFERYAKLMRDKAQIHLEAKLTSAEQIKMLEENFDLAKAELRAGRELEHVPTLDNIDTYAKLLAKEEKKEEKDEKPE